MFGEDFGCFVMGWSELKLGNETILKPFPELSFTQEDSVGELTSCNTEYLHIQIRYILF